ncbi:MAG: hypothetical protein VR65_23255 [Desulfobulbaceae bacterium BRH_c16a]|nr:MAG: hypothetical protein VR65_23255 [Desulfobulbaceae bacterium BRH_c16a]
MMDRYRNFAELEQNERENQDYKILYRQRVSQIAVMAPHGGGIEPGTLDIADALAGSEYTFYAFKGLKKSGNKILHLTSSSFDEPRGLKIAENAFIVISIHGNRDTGEIVFIGGKNHELKQGIRRALRTAGFEAVITEVPGLRGIDPRNICNRCRSGEGVQLEVSRGLREKLFENLACRTSRKKTNDFYHFINTVKQALCGV